jgi:uncharacterized protein (DUF58 family)
VFVQASRVRWAITGNAAAFVAVLIAMWYSGSSQQNGAAYLLLFGLTGLGIVSIPHAFSNVRGLTARAEAIKPTFAGQETTLPIEISNGSRTARKGLRVRLPSTTRSYETIGLLPPGKAARTSLRFLASRRGEHQIDAICLETFYPLGLLRIKRVVDVTQRYLVYPKPDGNSTLPELGSPNRNGRRRELPNEGDDFAGVRAYVPGESQRHIDWKAVARGQPMMTKQFSDENDSGPLYLDYSSAGAGELEERLSQLSLWILEAERLRRPYGLRLPSVEIPPSLGEMHFHRCLRTLALF